jgi:radical SAM superfamily enzyme
MGNKKSKEGCLHCGNDDEGITADKRGAKVPEIEEIIKKMTDNYKREKIDIEDFLAYFDADYKFLHKAFAFACSQGKAGHESFADLEGLRRLCILLN